jgi:hypothetical protein
MNAGINTKSVIRSFVFLFFFSTFVAFSESNRFDIERLSFSVSPKILKDGSITDSDLEWGYSDALYGKVHFRFTTTSKNEEFENLTDSLNATKENVYEVFLLPIEYYFFGMPKTGLWVGGGFYYQYSTLNEKGFFNMPELEKLSPPRERVNSYTNEVSIHLLGPLFEAGVSRHTELFNISLSGGIVPIFFLRSSQKTGIVPLLDSHFADYSQDTWGSPYFYLSMDGVILKYFNIVLQYDFAKLRYKVLDFDGSLNWITPETTVATQAFKIEPSLLIPLDSSMRVQLGYGYIFDFTKTDSASSVMDKRRYLILTAKKIIK